MESTRSRRGQFSWALPEFASGSGEPVALEWKREAVGETGYEPAVPIGCSLGSL